MYYLVVFFIFFFKQKTAYEMRISDWSSDVCSSDLGHHALVVREVTDQGPAPTGLEGEADAGCGRVDLRRADDGNQQQRGDQAGGDRRDGTAWRHGHQNADRVAASGSIPPSDGSASTAIDPAGMPR